MDAITLAAAELSDWYNMRGFSASPITVTLKIAGGAVATVRISNDDSDDKADAQTWTYALSTTLELPAPLPNFVQIENSGAAGTVVFALGDGQQSVTATPPPLD